MSSACLAFSFPSAGEIRVHLPGGAGPLAPGDAVAPHRAHLEALGIDAGTVVGERLVRLVGGLALARVEGRPHVSAAELRALAFPGRSPRTVPNVLAECLRKETTPRASLASPWRGPEDRSLVQVAQREGRVLRSVGPVRLNPLYRVEVVADALRRWLTGAETDAAELRALGWDGVAERVGPLVAAGEEGRAWQLLAPLDDAPDHRVVLLRAQLGMQVGASDEAGELARAAGLRAAAGHDRVLHAESLHVRALTARQRGDLAGSLRAVTEAIGILRALPRTPDVRARAWQYRLTRAITLSASAFTPTRHRAFLLLGEVPEHWAAATLAFRKLAREAEDAGHARDAAHAALRLAAHELGRWEVRDEGHASVARALAGRADLPPAAQVILDRVLASDALLRTGDPAARARLAAIRAKDEARGYRHQVKTIDDTVALARAARARR